MHKNNYLRNIHSRNYGFTLLEILMVIAVLGIITVLGISFLGKRDRPALQEGQTSFAQSLERVRTLVRRYAYDYVLTIATDNKSYIFKAQTTKSSGTQAAVTNSAPDISGKMPDTVRLKLGTTSSFILTNPIYLAPYSRLGTGGAPICFEFSNTASTLKTATDLVGITGKVVNRAISTATPCN
jgi:prepilin-type N-terminal cleavage/methylation domain-containing protein